MGCFGYGDESNDTTTQNVSNVSNVGASDQGTAFGGDFNYTQTIDGGELLSEKALDTGAALTGATLATIERIITNQASTDTTNRALDQDILKTSMAENNLLMQSSLDRIAGLSASQVSGGQTDFQRTLLYLVGGMLVLFGFIFFLNRK